MVVKVAAPEFSPRPLTKTSPTLLRASSARSPTGMVNVRVSSVRKNPEVHHMNSKADSDNRTEQLNPETPKYWLARGCTPEQAAREAEQVRQRNLNAATSPKSK